MPCEPDVIHRSSIETASNRFRYSWLEVTSNSEQVEVDEMCVITQTTYLYSACSLYNLLKRA